MSFHRPLLPIAVSSPEDVDGSSEASTVEHEEATQRAASLALATSLTSAASSIQAASFTSCEGRDRAPSDESILTMPGLAASPTHNEVVCIAPGLDNNVLMRPSITPIVRDEPVQVTTTAVSPASLADSRAGFEATFPGSIQGDRGEVLLMNEDAQMPQSSEEPVSTLPMELMVPEVGVPEMMTLPDTIPVSPAAGNSVFEAALLAGSQDVGDGEDFFRNGSVSNVMHEGERRQSGFIQWSNIWPPASQEALQPQTFARPSARGPEFGLGSLAVGAAFRNILAVSPTNLHSTLQISASPDSMESGYTHSVQRILHWARDGCTFYIGITENPDRRWSEHSQRGLWSLMDILVMAPSSYVTSELERRLIERFGHMVRCTNVGRGGERSSQGRPHYLYVLVGLSGLLRR